MRRRAAPNRQAAGVSLFPFLAVLLCTMGALIVVLVVIARQAHLQVIASAQPPPDDELALKRSELEWRISQLRESREATKKLLSDKQTELSHFEEHSRRLRGQLEELVSARQRLDEMAAGDSRDQAKLKSELERLQYRVAGLRGELGKLMEKARHGQESYAIIPYHGPNETYRRPIYIECRATGIILQPAGLTLTEQDFIIDSGPSNPLASALRAAREYYLRNSLTGQGETGSAYPLMIVRPDGVLAYHIAKTVLESSGPDFGYELVAQDWPIEYPPADPMLVLVMKQAISEGRRGQAYLASAAPGLFYNSRHVSFRTAPRGLAAGGSAWSGIHQSGTGGRSGWGTPSGRPASVAGGTGRLPGGGTGGPGAGDNPYLDALASNPGEGAKSSKARVQGSAAPGQGPGGGPAGNQPPGRGNAGKSGIGGIGIGSQNAGDPLVGGASGPRSGGNGPGGSGFKVQGSGLPGQGVGGNAQGSGVANQGPGAGGQGPGTGGQGPGRPLPGQAIAGLAAVPGPQRAGNGGAPANGRGIAGATNGARGGNLPTGELASAGGMGTMGSAGATGGPATRAGVTGVAGGGPATRAGATGVAGGRQPVAISGAAGGSQATRSGAAAGSSQAGSALASDGDGVAGGDGAAGSSKRSADIGQLASAARGAGGGRSSAGGPSSNGSSRGSSGGGSSSSSGASNGGSTSAGGGSPLGGSMGANQMQPGQMGMPMPMVSMGAQPPAGSKPSSSRGSKRERNWANPDASTSNVPVERRIRIVCDAEHLTIMPEGRAARGMRVIKLGPRTEDSLDDLVSTVWDRIDSWGMAGRGMYWRPRLLMEIEPGGQRRYTELQSLLADSGFDVHGRPRTVKRGSGFRVQGSGR